MIARTPELEEFGADARRWLAEHVPYGWRSLLGGASTAEVIEFQRWWLAELHGSGFAAIQWPEEFGGSGASVMHQVVLEQELMAADAPELPLFFVSLNQAGTTLISHGTPDQQAHLPAILAGEIWSQGFSEPDAGSDLAGLTTTADRQGDEYVVNGQKLWSSHAQHSQWCLLLARTDRSAPKHKGISMFMLDMATSGVEVRPVRQLTGEAEFCEIFLDDVRIPASHLIGEENGGWALAQTTLSAERGPVMLQLSERLRAQCGALVGLAASSGAADDPLVRQQLGRLTIEVDVLQQMAEQMLRGLVDGTGGVVDSSVLKVVFSETLQQLTAIGLEIQGLDAFVERPPSALDFSSTGIWLLDHLASWRWTIAAGSNQIQRTLIGERGLGLPREPVPA